MSVREHARCGGLHAGGEGHAGARPFAFASSSRHFERDRPFAIEHLAIDLRLDFAKKSVQGNASLTLKRIDPEARSIVLDAVGFSISKVEVDGKPAKHVYDGKLLSCELPRGFDAGVLTVVYAATPRRGLYFLEPDEHVPNRPRQAWTQCQEEDARHIFPCHDKPHVKMTTAATIHVPEGYSVLSNGALVSHTKGKGEETFVWRMDEPHPSYLVTIVAGDFAVIETKADIGGGKSVPLSYLVPKDREVDVERTFGRTPAMVTYFSELTGVPYPWNKYAQVVVSDFIFGGMENTTATTMNEHIMLDPRAALDVTSDDLIAHELAHQWFGDYVTCRDWSEGWLNEGFATFMEHVWREKHLGRDEYFFGLRNDLDSYLDEATGRYRRPVVCQEYDAPLDLFDRHLYEKGGLALHAIRTELGDELFWKGVRLYLGRHARGIVETRDFQRALEEVSGRSLGRRLDELVHRAGHPELDVDLSWADGVLTCAARQTQSIQDNVPAVFEISITLAIGEDRVEKVKLAARSDTFAIPCAERPRWVVVDPDLRIIGDVTVKAPADMLRRQLTEAPTARGRWLAADSLGRIDDPPTIEALAGRLKDEGEFWGVRNECAEALGRIRAREAFVALSEAASTSQPKVRRAVAAALGRFRTGAAVEALRPLALRDPSWIVEAEAARSLGKTRQAAAYDVLLDIVDRPSWADVVSSGAIDGFANLRDERALPHLFARTRYGHPTRVRRAAAVAIPKISVDRRAREHLEELLDDPDPILRMDVVRALTELGDARSRAALRARLDVDLDARVRRRIRETLRELGTERKRDDQVRDDVERLQSDYAELKGRLAKLEASGGVEKVKKSSPAKPAPKKAAKAKSKRRR